MTNKPETIPNLLPFDGIATYYGQLMQPSKSNAYLEELLSNIEWKNDEVMMFGKLLITRRKVAWYGDKPFGYTYSRVTKQALLWTPALRQLKNLTESRTGHSFNSCLLNLYHTGAEGMAWHSDGEKDLQENGAIASLSFGAERKFSFRHKDSGTTISVLLEHGSLLVMKGSTQKHWHHRLPPTSKVSSPRVNLTFRTIIPPP